MAAIIQRRDQRVVVKMHVAVTSSFPIADTRELPLTWPGQHLHDIADS